MFVDLFLVYSFVRKLTTPFVEWEAYKLGIIDSEGNLLKSRKSFKTVAERDAFGHFDLMVLNLKRLIEKLPGGKAKIATYAAALYLVRENSLIKEEVSSRFENMSDQMIEEVVFQEFFEGILVPYFESEAPNMTVGSGAIAGLGYGESPEPPIKRKKKRDEK